MTSDERAHVTPAAMRGDSRRRRVSVHAVRLHAVAEPVDIFSHLAGTRGLFFLDSARRDAKCGRYSFIGFEPFSTIRFRGGIADVVAQGAVQKITVDPFDLIAAEIGRFEMAATIPYDLADIPFLGGAAGYLSYDLGRYVERLPSTAADDLLLPEMHLGFYDRLIAFDHLTAKSWVIVSDAGGCGDLPSLAQRIVGRVEGASRIREEGDPADSSAEGRAVAMAAEAAVARSNYTRGEYIEMVKRAVEYIAAGDIFQVNLSQRLTAPLRETPHEVYVRLRRVSPGDFACYLDAGEFQILSSSPERFLRVKGRLVETCPIKGTRLRLLGEADEAVRQELFDSEKDNAELAMIVDLERNDLGRVCEYGSIEVTEAKRLDSYATVHHLSAVVRGRLREGRGPAELLRATFPGGSISGAPKVRAMEIIEELEPVRRGVYTGAIGYMGYNKEMDLNIAIRTLVARGGVGYFSVGGGIVYDSDPAGEYDESIAKAKGIMAALGARL